MRHDEGRWDPGIPNREVSRMSRPQPSGRRLRPIVAATSGLAIGDRRRRPHHPAGARHRPPLRSPPPQPRPMRPPAASHTVTLITGDRVTVTDLSDGTHAVAVDDRRRRRRSPHVRGRPATSTSSPTPRCPTSPRARSTRTCSTSRCSSSTATTTRPSTPPRSSSSRMPHPPGPSPRRCPGSRCRPQLAEHRRRGRHARPRRRPPPRGRR